MRGYFDAITLNPPPGQSVGGFVNVYAVGEDPNGVLSGDAGDFAFEVGTSNAYSCSGGTVWVQVIGGGGTPATRTNFTFHPGGTDDPENGIYTDFEDCHAAAELSVAAGNLVTLIIDDSDVSPAVIPPGEFDMTNIQLFGAVGLNGGALYTAVTTSAGTAFAGDWTRGCPFISLTHAHTAALYTTPLASTYIFVTGIQSRYVAGSTGVIWNVLAGGGDPLILIDEYTEFGGGNAEIFAIATGRTLTINAFGRLLVNADSFEGAGDVTISAEDPFSTISETQTNLGGTLTVFRPESDQITYVAGTPGDWAVSAPTDVQDALDRLASAVEGLLLAPIP